MNLKVNYPVAQTAVFLWLGFVLSISFMEAWLKFQAPGITIPLGLGVGQLVFGALNLMEWVFTAVIGANFLLSKQKLFTKSELYYLLAVTLLLLQSIWLLPELDERATAVINGQNPPESNLHFIYVGFEIIKVIALFLFGTKLYKKTI
ncbi:MAG TPA: hypothetical protein VFM65_11100 [Flavobacteriaceae bacterium]|nr:hypothetical protein [Flavobacteriaceae bacterium]